MKIVTSVGGMSCIWLKEQIDRPPDVLDIRYLDMNEKLIMNNIYFIKHLWSCSWNIDEMPSNIKNKKVVDFILNDPRNKNGKFFCEIYDNKFLHYRAGGDWERRGLSNHIELTNKLKDLL